MRGRVSLWAWVLLGALAVGSLLPLVQLMGDAGSLRLLTGADGPFAADQLRYVSWIRQAGESGLAGNGFDLAAGGRVFVHPMFTTSGVLSALGLAPPIALLVWKPVAVAILWAGTLVYVRRLVTGAGAQLSACVLALFAVSPLVAAFHYLDLAGAGAVALVGGESLSAASLWGYLPTAIAVGLMPVFLIAFTEQLRSTATDRSSRIALTCAAASGLAVSWLHPWQGETLALAALGLVLWSRPPRGRLAPCALAVGALAAPLIYYYLLSRLDGGWELAYEASRSVYTGRPLAALLPVFAPVAILAAFGVRRNELDDPLACTLVLWPASTLAVYLASPTFPPHVLTGVALPLAILAVRGWQRIVPTSRPGVAVLLIAAATVPGVLAIGEITRQDLRSSAQSAILEPGERKALSYLERRPEPGGVIAANGIAAAVPGLTGKPVWSGHPQWTADFDARRATSAQLFAGQLRGAPARDLISGTGVRWLVADCAGGRDLTTTVGATTLRRMSFGCAAVYEIRRPAGGTDP